MAMNKASNSVDLFSFCTNIIFELPNLIKIGIPLTFITAIPRLRMFFASIWIASQTHNLYAITIVT